ncbi:MAG: hypothetical protein AAF390_10490 [Pseudomonadota bacterium]
MSTDGRAVLAAGNNADLYEAVFAAHGLRWDRRPEAFVAMDPPPPYYGAVTVLTPDAPEAVAAAIAETTARFGRTAVKDSFRQISPTTSGLDVLFEAHWIWHDRVLPSTRTDWRRVTGDADLLRWESAWAGAPIGRRMFSPAFAARPEIAVLGREVDGLFVEGCIANRSDGCVGLSNLFSAVPSAEVFARALSAVTSAFAGRPVAGYERGAALDAARAAGCETVGALRVLASPVAGA